MHGSEPCPHIKVFASFYLNSKCNENDKMFPLFLKLHLDNKVAEK